MADVSHIFKAYDIRGKVGDELNEELSRNVARAFADWLPDPLTVATLMTKSFIVLFDINSPRLKRKP